MPGWFWSEIRKHGARPALVVPGREPVTYAELTDRARDFADRLAGNRKLVAIEMAPSEHAVVAYAGALLGGHVVAPLPQGDPASLAAFVDRFAPEIIYRRVGNRWRIEEAFAVDSPLHPDLAQVLVTSGTTGGGKAVRLSQAAVDSNARAIAAYLGLTPADRAALVLPLHYCYGLSVLTSHLAAGGSVDLGSGSVLDAGFVERIAETGCTNLAGVPYTYELLERIGFRHRMPAGLRFMTAAGGRLDPALVRTYDVAMRGNGGRFFVMYGQTEATARIAYLPPERAASAPDRIGVAIPGGKLSLVDEGGRPLRAAGSVGELVYRGPNVMMGYARDRAGLARGPETDVLMTGDLAEADGQGLFRIVGRRARFSKIAGVRIGHDAIEAALAESGIAAAVTGDDRGLLVAYTGAHPADDVRRRVAEASRLTGRHVRVAGAHELPRLESGKLDLAALRALFVPVRDRDQRITQIFRETFYPHKVLDSDSFASLAGDSLRFVELSCALERRLGHAPDGWETMTVAELSALERRGARGASRIHTDLVIRALAIVLVVAQHATLWPVPVGSAAMVVLIGFGLARFQHKSLVDGDFARFLRPLPFVLLPYYAIVAGYALAWGEVPWASVLLVGNLGIADPVQHTMVPYLYWFVEVYIQVMLLIAGVFAFSPVRNFAARNPFGFALAFLAAALAFRAAGQLLYPVGDREIFTLYWVLHLCAFGWCAALANTPRRRALVLAAAVVVMPAVAWAGGNWVGSWIRFGMQILVVGALLYLPVVTLPTRLASAVLTVAAASFNIYLFHRFLPELVLVRWETEWSPAVFASVSILGGVAVGISVFAIQREIRAHFAARASGRPAFDPIPGATS